MVLGLGCGSLHQSSGGVGLEKFTGSRHIAPKKNPKKNLCLQTVAGLDLDM